MFRLLTALCFLATASLVTAGATPPIPVRPPGYRKGSPSAPVRLEAFVDLLCPDSKAAWPVIQDVYNSYTGDVLELVVHLFPLPYHTNAFATAQSALVVNSLGADFL